METQELLAQARRRLQVSDHFLTQSYPLIKDPKLLVNVLEGLARASEDMIDAILQTEHTAGRVPAYHESNLVAKTALIKGEVARRYQISHLDIELIHDMHQLLQDHKKSSVEFARRGKYIIASNDYRLATLSVEKIKTYLSRSKTLLAKIHDSIIPQRRN